LSVIILKNIGSEGPGNIAGFLRDNRLSYKVIEPEGVARATMEDSSSLVVLGGPMGLHEADEYPQINAGMRLMEAALKKDIPVLGICLGAQMLSNVLGARVYKGEQGQEVGWYDITLTREGAEDPALSAYAEGGNGVCRVFHWHGDTFDIPDGAVRLAGSEMYDSQAFRYGEMAYGLQFHLEVTAEMVDEWMKSVPGGRRWTDESALYMDGFELASGRFCREFFKYAN